jgi:hypothetical protein
LASNWQTCAEKLAAGACYGAKRKLFKLCVINTKSDVSHLFIPSLLLSDVSHQLIFLLLLRDFSHPLISFGFDERRQPPIFPLLLMLTFTCSFAIDERRQPSTYFFWY